MPTSPSFVELKLDTSSLRPHAEGAAAPIEDLLREASAKRLCIRMSGASAPLTDETFKSLADADVGDVIVLIITDQAPDPESIETIAAAITQSANAVAIDFLLPIDARAHDAVYDAQSCISKILSASRPLIKKNYVVRWLAPAVSPLLYRLEGLFSLGEDHGVETSIVAEDGLASLNENDRLFLKDFILHRLFDEGVCRLGEQRCDYYQSLLKCADQQSRPLVEALQLWPSPDKPGEYLQQEVQQSVFSPNAAFFTEKTASGAAGQSGYNAAEAAAVLRDGALSHIAATLSGAADKAIPEKLSRVLLIGAYGGEHIGDAAILGGVAFRLHEQYGADSAILMSQRPDHTRHLTPMLETPVSIDVREYTRANIRTALREVDAVVFAGGPLIDLPKQLVRHLYAASLACRSGKPFLMEGIGPGPFPRAPSEFTARRLVKMASAVTVRTRESAVERVMRDIPLEIGRDPAFDYLAMRPQILTKIAPGEAEAVDRLLAGSEGRPVVGLNIRPIYDQYTVGAEGEDKASFTLRIEDQLERRLAAAFSAFHASSNTKPLFVFFPMNAVQFGLSDLKSAYRIGRHLGDEIDYRVWEADASLDGVLALIRRLDVAITMRFHATIFALSQGIEAIGIDYRVGKRDKVAAVLSDAGKEDQCTRIDLMTTDWMVEQLNRLILR